MPATSRPLAGGDDDYQQWLRRVAASKVGPTAGPSSLGARAIKQDATSPANSQRLRSSASAASSKAAGGDFFLYRGQMLPKGRWEHDPLRTEVSALQKEMRSGRDVAASMQHRSIGQWNPLSAAASAAELKYGYRWGAADAVDRGGLRTAASAPGTLGMDASLVPPRTAGGMPSLSGMSPRSASPARAPFSELLGGQLFEEVEPPPPESEIPEEYALYDLSAEHRTLSVGAETHGGGGAAHERGERYRVFPAVVPSNRSQVTHLAHTLERMLEAAGPRTPAALQAWDATFSELVRQVFVQCSDRGELLGRVRRAYQHYLSQLLKKVQRYEADEREVELRRLRDEVDELRERLGETTSAVKRTRMVGMLRGAIGNAAEKARAKEDAARKDGVPGSGASAMMTAFSAASQNERETIWADMITHIPLKQRVQLLDFLWGVFPTDRHPQLLRGLTGSLPQPAQAILASEVAETLPFEERQACVEKLLRALAPHEMEGFVDFLPWIWGEYKLPHTAKLYATLTDVERRRVVTMIENGTVEPAPSGPPPSRTGSAVAGAAAAKALLGKDDDDDDDGEKPKGPKMADAFTQTFAPREAAAAAAPQPAAPPAAPPPAAAEVAAPPPRLEATSPAQIAAWAKYSPSDGGGGAPLGLEAFLEVSADCFEAALSSMKNTPNKKANWPKAVFNTLLKRAGDSQKKGGLKRSQTSASGAIVAATAAAAAEAEGGKKGGGGKKSAMTAAKEALFALLRASQTHAAASPRALLFARLSGLHGPGGDHAAAYAEARVERVLRVLARLYPESVRRVREVLASERGAVEVPMHGVTANVALVLRSMVDEIGVGTFHELQRSLEAAAVVDPAGDTGAKKVALDAALLAVVDKHDAARAASAEQLRGVFRHFDLDGNGNLDLPEFTALMEACESGVSGEQVRAMFVDCARLSRRLRPELPDDSIVIEAFLGVCESYGMQMRIQSTVVQSGVEPDKIKMPQETSRAKLALPAATG